MRSIRMGVSGLKPTDLVAKAVVILEAMTDNPYFPTPNPPLPALEQAKDELALAIGAAVMGNINDRITRDLKAKEVEMAIRLLAYYVTSVGAGNEQILASSGFELKKLPEPLAPVTAPLSFLAQRSPISGEVLLKWKAVKGAKSYVIEMSKQDPENQVPNWVQIQVTSKSRTEISDLSVGNFYRFRVRAVGGSNKSAWSDLSEVMVA